MRVVKLRVTRSDEFGGVPVRAAADTPWHQVISSVFDAAQPGPRDRVVRLEVQSSRATTRQAQSPAPPPTEVTPSPSGATGARLTDHVAVLFPKELHVLRKGTPYDAAPIVVALPRQVVRQPLWASDGRLFVALAGGEVAAVEGDSLRVIQIPKAFRKMKNPPRGTRPRRGWDWTGMDGLVGATDGSVWMQRCQWAESRGSCSGLVYFRLDAPQVTRAERDVSVRSGERWPALEAPTGYEAAFVGDGRWAVSCKSSAVVSIPRSGSRGTLHVSSSALIFWTWCATRTTDWWAAYQAPRW